MKELKKEINKFYTNIKYLSVNKTRFSVSDDGCGHMK